MAYKRISPQPVVEGGTGAQTLTIHGVLVGEATAAIVATAAGTTNTVLLGNTGADPSFGTVPNAALTNSSVTLNNGNNITVTGSPLSLGGTASFNLTGTTNHTVQLGNASGSLNSLANGTTGQILTAVTGADPNWLAPATSSITITGDTGGGLTGASFTFTGGTTGLSFGGAGSTETLTFAGITANGGTVSLATDATTSTINVGTGAGIKTSTFGSTNSTSATTVQSGSGALNITATGGALTINSGTGALGLSTDSTNTTISLGTGAGAKLITLGSTNGASSLTQHVGTGNYVLDGVAGSTYTVGASTTTGTITIGGTAQSGTMTLGSSSAGNTQIIAGGSGATTLQIANVQTAGSVAIGAGMTTGTITIGGTGLQTGTITFGGGTGAQTVNIGTGGTGIKTIHIGDSAVANVITIGSTTGAASLNLQSGSGNIVHNAGLTVDSTGRTTNSVQPCFYAYVSPTVNNVTGDGTNYTIIFNNTVFDQNSNFNTGTGVFTAPKTGRYQFNVTVNLQGMTASDTNVQVVLNATSRAPFLFICNPSSMLSSGQIIIGGSTILDMTANDTAFIQVLVSGSTKSVNVAGSASGTVTRFTGFLIC